MVFRLLAGVALGVLWLLGALLTALALHESPAAPLRLALVNFDGLVFLHAAGCVSAAGYGGDLVFGREIRHKTLAAVQMLPQGAALFVWRKVTFPFYAIGIAWSAGIPLYVLAVLLNLATAAEALRGLLITGWTGLAVLALTLLGTSGQSPPPLDPIEKRMHDMEATCRGLLVSGAGLLVMWLALTGWISPGRWGFFGLRVPTALPGWVLTGVLGPLAVSHGRDLLLGELSSYRRPMCLAGAGLAVVYLLALGAFWPGLPLWGRALAVVGPVLLGLLNGWQLCRLLRSAAKTGAPVSKPKRKEDPWTERELAWIAARWNNPLLLRDLRASLRAQSLRSKLRDSLIGQPLLVVVIYFLVKWFGGAVLSGAASWLLTPLFSGGGTASAFWNKEKKSGALPLLLLTPLSSREILGGRLAASIVLGLPLLTLPLLLFIGGVGWLAFTRFWPVGPMVLSVLPLLLGAWVAMGCTNAIPERVVSGFESNPVFRLVEAGVVVLIPVGLVVILLAAQGGPLPCYGLALLVGCLQLGFAAFIFREYERKLEAYRHSDVDPGAI